VSIHLLDLSGVDEMSKLNNKLLELAYHSFDVILSQALNDVGQSLIELCAPSFILLHLRLDFEHQSPHDLEHVLHVGGVLSVADYVLDAFEDLSPDQVVLALCPALQQKTRQVLVPGDDRGGRAVLDEARLLHELEEVDDYLVLLLELLQDLLHLSVLSALVVFLVLLLGVGCSRALGLRHVGFVLVLLLLVLSKLGLDLLEGDAAALFYEDAVLRYHVDKTHAGVDNLLLLL